MKGKQKLIKLKIIRPNQDDWWYNDHVGKTFDIIDFYYYSNGQNYYLNGDIKNLQSILECMKKYGNINLYTKTKHNNWLQIHLENTNYKLLLRKAKMEKIKNINEPKDII